jgi:hypothetical protein
MAERFVHAFVRPEFRGAMRGCAHARGYWQQCAHVCVTQTGVLSETSARVRPRAQAMRREISGVSRP